MLSPVAVAYSMTGAAWQRGPGPVYDRLAQVVVERSPIPVAGVAALDVGAGTGAASRALLAAGASSVVAVDAAPGMLAFDAARRPSAVVADALALPFADATFDLTIAAFSFNHLAVPEAALREAVRVTRRRGAILVSAYANDDAHPVKRAVEGALAARGWSAPAWYRMVQSHAVPRLATLEGCRRVARGAGVQAQATSIRVPMPDLGAAELVAWRLGMAQHAPFVASLPSDADREAVAHDATARLGADWPPLERSIVVIRAVKP